MTDPRPLDFEYLIELYGWLLRVREEIAGDPPYANHLSAAQAEVPRTAFQVLAPRGYANGQVKQAVEHIFATSKWDPKKSFARSIEEAIAELRPQPVYSAIDPSQGKLPPAMENVALPPGESAIAQLKSAAADPDCPNLSLSEVALTYFDWGQVSLSDKMPPKMVLELVDPTVDYRFQARIHLSARKRFKDLLGPKWHVPIKEALESTGSVDELFGDRRVFCRGNEWNPPKKSEPVTELRPDQPKRSRLEGRLPA